MAQFNPNQKDNSFVVKVKTGTPAIDASGNVAFQKFGTIAPNQNFSENQNFSSGSVLVSKIKNQIDQLKSTGQPIPASLIEKLQFSIPPSQRASFVEKNKLSLSSIQQAQNQQNSNVQQLQTQQKQLDQERQNIQSIIDHLNEKSKIGFNQNDIDMANQLNDRINNYNQQADFLNSRANALQSNQEVINSKVQNLNKTITISNSVLNPNKNINNAENKLSSAIGIANTPAYQLGSQLQTGILNKQQTPKELMNLNKPTNFYTKNDLQNFSNDVQTVANQSQNFGKIIQGQTGAINPIMGNQPNLIGKQKTPKELKGLNQKSIIKNDLSEIIPPIITGVNVGVFGVSSSLGSEFQKNFPKGLEFNIPKTFSPTGFTTFFSGKTKSPEEILNIQSIRKSQGKDIITGETIKTGAEFAINFTFPEIQKGTLGALRAFEDIGKQTIPATELFSPQNIKGGVPYPEFFGTPKEQYYAFRNTKPVQQLLPENPKNFIVYSSTPNAFSKTGEFRIGTSETPGGYVVFPGEASTKYLQLSGESPTTLFPEIFNKKGKTTFFENLIPKPRSPSLLSIEVQDITRIPKNELSSFSNANEFLLNRAERGKVYAPSPAFELGTKTEAEGIIPAFSKYYEKPQSGRFITKVGTERINIQELFVTSSGNVPEGYVPFNFNNFLNESSKVSSSGKSIISTRIVSPIFSSSKVSTKKLIVPKISLSKSSKSSSNNFSSSFNNSVSKISSSFKKPSSSYFSSVSSKIVSPSKSVFQSISNPSFSITPSISKTPSIFKSSFGSTSSFRKIKTPTITTTSTSIRIPPIKPPTTIINFKKSNGGFYKRLTTGFDVFVKKSKYSDDFLKLNRKGLDLTQALGLGKLFTGEESIKQTFLIRKSNELVPTSNFSLPDLSNYYTKQSKQGLRFIEKRKYAISSPSEKKQLSTSKALKNLRRRTNGFKFRSKNISRFF